jgi:uncharacterized membrane protein YqiK
VTGLLFWVGLVGGSSLGVIWLGRRCVVQTHAGPVVVRGRRLRKQGSGRLKLVRPGQTGRCFRLPLLQVAQRLDLPLRLQTLVPYAYCQDGTPVSFQLTARVVLGDDPQALEDGLPRLVAARRPYLRALLESELDRAARAVVRTLSPRRAALRRGMLAGRVAEMLRPELRRWGLVTAELEASAPSCRPLPDLQTPTASPPARWRWTVSRRAENTPGASRKDVETVNTTRERGLVHG